MAISTTTCVFSLQNTDRHQKFLSFNSKNVLVIEHQYAINTQLAARNARAMPVGAMARIQDAFDAKGSTLFLRSNFLTIVRVECGAILMPGEAFMYQDNFGAVSYWVFVQKEDKKSGYLVNFTDAVVEEVFGEDAKVH